jgi:hypothetical protein
MAYCVQVGGNCNTVYSDPITVSFSGGTVGNISILGATNIIPHPFSVSDFTITGLSNVTLLLSSTSSNNNNCYIFVGIITASSYSWTFKNTLGNVGLAALGAAEFSGMIPYIPQMATHTAKSNSKSANATTGPLYVQAGTIIIACVDGWMQTYAAPAGYSEIYNQSNTSYALMDMSFYTAPADGSYNPTWTNDSDNWASAAIGLNSTLNQIMIYDGANWIPCTINYWNGSAWTVQELDIYEAGAFLPVYQSAV